MLKSGSESSGILYIISRIFFFESKAAFLKAISYIIHPRDHIELVSSFFSPFKISGL